MLPLGGAGVEIYFHGCQVIDLGKKEIRTEPVSTVNYK
jgi:hypothetical protein